MRNPLFGLLLLLSLSGSFAMASEDGTRVLGAEDDGFLQDASDLTPSLPPEDRYQRTNEVFRHFQIPLEAPQAGGLAPYDRAQTAATAAKILTVLDPSHQFNTWFTADGTSLTGFLDGGVKRLSDFSAGFAPADGAVRPTGLLDKLHRAARGNPGDRPLLGLRIALDPGHMGTDLWDVRTGKFVKDAQGNKISEGLINLQTCLLLEQELTALGANVVITHRELAPVYAVPYEKLSLQDFARREVHNESLQPWFQALLQAGTGAPLAAAFDQSAQVKKLFSEFERINYFQLRADLDARVDFLRQARPDITLIVHYDTGSGTSSVNPKPLDGTKSYVVGAFEPAEFGTQKLRTQLGRKMVDREGWDASLRLNRLVVNQLQRDLAIPFSKAGGGTSFAVEPGVFARNLGIPSQLDGQAVSYVEVLCYDDPTEFQRLRQFTSKMTIGGVDYPYSDRLVTAADAIRKGVVSFVQSFAN